VWRVLRVGAFQAGVGPGKQTNEEGKPLWNVTYDMGISQQLCANRLVLQQIDHPSQHSQEKARPTDVEGEYCGFGVSSGERDWKRNLRAPTKKMHSQEWGYYFNKQDDQHDAPKC